MKIVILAVGTIHDVRPCARLAKQLVKKNHDVTLIAFDVFKEYIENTGARFIQYPCASEALINGKTAESVSEMMSYIKKLCESDSDLVRETLLEASQGADVLLYTDKSLGMVYIGESLKTPYIRLSFTPDAPTSAFRCIYSGECRVGGIFRRIYNKMTHILYNRKLVKIQKNSKKSWCKPLGIKNKFKLCRKYLDGSGIENLLGCSDLILPESDDLRENMHIVGYFSDFECEDTYTPPADLAEFLKNGNAPVYVKFTDASEYDHALSTVLQALKLAGKRAVVGGDTSGEKLPENAICAKDVPYEWLFSRCEAVIQHGDAEITANALMAGKPTLVIPVNNEQTFWGNRVYERGLGTKPMHPKKLIAVSFAEVIDELCSPEYTERAEYVGKLLKAEDGAGRAVDFIEREYGEQ